MNLKGAVLLLAFLIWALVASASHAATKPDKGLGQIVSVLGPPVAGPTYYPANKSHPAITCFVFAAPAGWGIQACTLTGKPPKKKPVAKGAV